MFLFLFFFTLVRSENHVFSAGFGSRPRAPFWSRDSFDSRAEETVPKLRFFILLPPISFCRGKNSVLPLLSARVAK
jgi:hypothetical protein